MLASKYIYGHDQMKQQSLGTESQELQLLALASNMLSEARLSKTVQYKYILLASTRVLEYISQVLYSSPVGASTRLGVHTYIHTCRTRRFLLATVLSSCEDDKSAHDASTTS
jgi:hypothetical protein